MLCPPSAPKNVQYCCVDLTTVYVKYEPDTPPPDDEAIDYSQLRSSASPGQDRTDETQMSTSATLINVSSFLAILFCENICLCQK